MKWVIQLQVEQ